MQIAYKKVPPQVMEKVLTYCRENTFPNNGLFEVYCDFKNKESTMVIVNSHSTDECLTGPLGIFYCNYLGTGVISYDDAREHDRAESRAYYGTTLKNVIDSLLNLSDTN